MYGPLLVCFADLPPPKGGGSKGEPGPSGPHRGTEGASLWVFRDDIKHIVG